MCDENPNYFAILPADVRYDKNLKPMEKILYAEITALLNMNGVCFASNEYFAKLYDVSEQSVSNWIRHLVDSGYFVAEYEMIGNTIKKRYLKLPKIKDENSGKSPCKRSKKTATTVSDNKDNKILTDIKNIAQNEDNEPKNDLEMVEQIYFENYKGLYEMFLVKTEKPIINWGQTRKLLRENIDKYGLQAIMQAVKDSVNNDFCVQKGYSLSTILSAGVLSSLINGNKFSKNKRGFGTAQGVDSVVDSSVLF